MAAADRPTRVASDLLDSARVEGARQSRSAKQQLDHWARVGRAVTSQQSLATRRVQEALAGRIPTQTLTPEEGVVFDAEVTARIEESLRATDYGKILDAQGLTTVALNDAGELHRLPGLSRIDLVVGPNGAGKTTFVKLTLAPALPGSVFVNADEIARRRWPDDPGSHAYEAAEIAARTRLALIAEQRRFIAETVFSHASKLDLAKQAKAAGYGVVLHALLVPEELAVRRVHYRALAGGHDVPEDKIRARYGRLWPLVADAMAIADNATVYDNSRRSGPGIVAQISAGILIGRATWPAWTPPPLCDRWP